MSQRGDYQRSAVYRWEAEHVHPKDTGTVSFDQAQTIVDYVWARAGLTYPPKIRELARTARRTTANAEHAKIPNVRNWAVRDYGNRVGVWRIMEVLTRYGIRASAALNSEVCHHH